MCSADLAHALVHEELNHDSNSAGLCYKEQIFVPASSFFLF
jgi:hypothetical protein